MAFAFVFRMVFLGFSKPQRLQKSHDYFEVRFNLVDL